MSASSEVNVGENANQSSGMSSQGGPKEKKNRRRRLRLSCGECRKKKLSCDRNLPCHRCVRSGRAGLCSFETEAEQPALGSHLTQQQAQRYSDENRELRAEVTQLKELLANSYSQQNDCNIETLPTIANAEFGQPGCLNGSVGEDRSLANVTNPYLSDPRDRSPRGYYSQHTLLQFFREIPQLFPFVKEIADEWLKPLGIQLKKNKPMINDWQASTPSEEMNPMEHLLPPKDITDALVFFYLNHFEQLHRVVHIPIFKREYANFWSSRQPRCPAMTALVLSMISMSSCAYFGSGGSTSIPSTYQIMAVQWISACEKWLGQQSSKHRKLVHYQVSCLIYLGKRMNIIKKKGFWKETGSLVQNAIMDGLHCDPSSNDGSPYLREMKRRIWIVIRELDLQNSFDYGLPTLLHSIDSNVVASANLDDEDFDESSEVLPIAKPLSQYTRTSYQSHSSRSWTLRLEISRRLYSTGASKTLNYDDVLRYTHEITQAIHSLPPWNIDVVDCDISSKSRVLTYAILQFQLTECILAIHRPYLQRDEHKFWLSENICYHMSREILLLNNKLAGLGIQSLTMLRDDLLLASLNLTRIMMMHPKASTSIIMTSSESTIELLDQCLPFIEERYLWCINGEPWCFFTMCAAIMLIKIHLGRESWQTAKSSCAQRFLNLHQKHIGKYQMSLLSQQDSISQDPVVQNNIDINSFDLAMELESIWEPWGSA